MKMMMGPPLPPPPPLLPFSSTKDNNNKCPQDEEEEGSIIPRPKSKMKSLNWTKIPVNPSSASTENIWSRLSQTKSELIQCVNFDLLEGWFRQPLPKSEPNSAAASPMIQRRSKRFPNNLSPELNLNESEDSHHSSSLPAVNILDRQKALNVVIFLRQFRDTPDDIICMIKEGDHLSLGCEGLSNLMKLLPTEEEERQLKILMSSSYRIHDRIPPAESFLHLLIQIPDYKLRVECMLFKEEYEALFSSLSSSVRVTLSAARELQQSQRLQRVLSLILVTGNFLNAGGYAGNASGFRIMSLLKLSEIRANKPGLNFLHFIAQQLDHQSQEDDKSASVFYLELPSLQEASKVAVDAMKGDIESLTKKISRIESQLLARESKIIQQEQESPIDKTDEVFFRKMQDFVRDRKSVV